MVKERIFQSSNGKGGGEFFGKVGDFDKGYEFDAFVLDDSLLPYPLELDFYKRLDAACICF